MTACSNILLSTLLLLSANAAAAGRDVSNRCSLWQPARIASWEGTAEGFAAVTPGATIRSTAIPGAVVCHGEKALATEYPSGEPARKYRSVKRKFAKPLNLSASTMISYGMMCSEGPGREMTSRMILRSTDGREYVSNALIIPSLWREVIFDVQQCPFLGDVAEIEIGMINNSDAKWEKPLFFLDDLKAGRVLDLDFEVNGSAARFNPTGGTKVTQKPGAAVVKFAQGGAVDLDLADSRNAIYNPELTGRNTVAVALDGGGVKALRLYYATNEEPNFSKVRSLVMPVSAKNGSQMLKFNLSALGAKGRLRSLRLEAEKGSGAVAIDRISFEREAPVSASAGEITACTATPERVTVKGRLNKYYSKAGGTVELRFAPIMSDGTPFDSLELLSTVPAAEEFVIADLPNKRSNAPITHLSSRFKAALRMPDGRVVEIGSPFFIENWRDFHSNPYAFATVGADYDAEKYGAKGNGVTNDNDAIQRAIDAAGAAGGGRVILRGASAGEAEREYIATYLELRTGVELVIERGAVLRQSPRFAHYAKYPPEYGHDNVIPGVPWTHSMYTNRPLILAKDVDRVKITGGGKIRMDDTFSENPAWTHYARNCSDRIHLVPVAVCHVNHVEISDIDILRTNNYHTIFYRADSVFIGNLKMHEVACLSGDGMSFGNAVTNVKAVRCVFESNDDGIVLCSSYKDPRGGVWRVRVDSIDSSVRNIEVLSSYINSACKGGGKAVAIIPWGSTNPRQDYSEIDRIHVSDCVLKGGQSVGCWPDNPFDGKPFTNAEPDDYCPVQNFNITGNEYLSPCEFFGVVPTTFINDCGLKSSPVIKNGRFADRLAYWTSTGSVSAPEKGEAKVANGTLYQGLSLEPGTYAIEWTGTGTIAPYAAMPDGEAISVTNGTFSLAAPATVLVGVKGANASVSEIKLINK